jgi:tRNA pseudouridine55 synthase
MELPVPIYSAAKVQGKKLYEYARSEQEVVIPKKTMTFWDVVPGEVGADWADFDIKCAKGGFIRTWVDVLGQQMGCGAAMSALRRTWSAPYFLDKAETFESIEAQVKSGQWGPAFVSMEQALPQVKRLRVKGQDQVLLGNGQISHDLRSQLITSFNPDQDQYIQIQSQETGHLLALVGLEAGRGFVIKRGFKY